MSVPSRTRLVSRASPASVSQESVGRYDVSSASMPR